MISYIAHEKPYVNLFEKLTLKRLSYALHSAALHRVQLKSVFGLCSDMLVAILFWVELRFQMFV